MYSGAKQGLLLAVLLTGMLLVASCENDINKIKEISAQESEKPVQETDSVDVIYSDSAKVKLRMLTPVLIDYNDTAKNAVPYKTTPKGVKIIFFDSLAREAGNIVADSGIQYPKTSIMEFHKNVVATNAEGSTFKSDELIWDQAKKKIYSNKPVTINEISGNVVYGTNFVSDERLTHPFFNTGSGSFNVPETP
ncbi:MAG: LPS export ABC transporter periplasmic protein LptC [Mucilaginibacter sp.]